MNLHDLRTQITVVGQEPLVIAGCTIRENLDLRGERTDEELYQTLRATELYGFVMELPEKLDAIIDNKKLVLSQGRKQLLMIARAILSKNQILVLDEVTSSMDEETDEIVQRLLVSPPSRFDCILCITYCSLDFRAKILHRDFDCPQDTFYH
jgi:ABC-type multidrug transport system fused ATPase/permease subunit